MAQQDTPISDFSLQAFLHCRYKSYLTINNKIGQASDFELHTAARNETYRGLVQSKLMTQHRGTDVLHSPPITLHTLQKGKPLILDARAQASSLSATIHALQKVGGTSLLGNFLYQPIQICYHDSPSKVETILLAFKSLVIGELQGQIPAHGTMVSGSHLHLRKVKLHGLQDRVSRLIRNLQTYINANTVPPLILNQHCAVCEYRTLCRDEAVASDNLSLLSGMTEREIVVQNRKGIFTVNQLSYTFRYRKPSKRAKRPAKPHQFSLQALALRTQKVHIHGSPNLLIADPAIYYDVEGLSHSDFYYLIGILLVNQNNIDYRSFWADSAREEAAAFQQFAEAVTNIPNIRLFHFGNYDTAAIKHARRICEPRYAAILDRIVKASTNVLTLINSQVYFPTYSNSLKDIASYLGFKWTEGNASGIQSIIWRDQWTLSGDPSLKRKLIQYNHEDCVALKTICDFIRSPAIAENIPPSSTCEQSSIVYTKDLSKLFHKWNRAVFALEDLERASKCAYFDYQRDRVFVRSSRRIAKAEKANKKKARSLPVNKRIEITCKRCGHCNSRKISPGKNITRRVIDLRFSSGGVRRWVVQYLSSRYQCRRCGKTFLPEGWPSYRGWYGPNLAKWCIYLNFECKQTMWNIKDTLRDVFGIMIDTRKLYGFKSQVISSYTGLYEQIRRHILASPVLHIDETDIAIRKIKGYVWIFATLDAVWYLYKGSRTGDFLKDMLSGVCGVLISDFYSAYDSINYPQQKCLLHLLREFNDDLKNSPYDEYLKTIASEFGRVLRSIIDTVDLYGLKKRHLHKHKMKAQSFIDRLRTTSFSSDVTLRYQKRFRRYGDKLFTFLDFDGVPWNNNSAEHAAKSFVKYKRTSEGLYTERSLNEALVMLSALETCRYNRVNFLRFLLTGRTELDAVIVR